MTPRILILADDLIWSSRLAAAAQHAGATVVAARSLAQLEAALADESALAGVVVDLGARRYDGVAAVQRAHEAGPSVLAVAQHDDVPLRKRALAAGADRVLSYNKMHADGPAVISRWLRRADQAPKTAVR
ncbi:MAG: hypothetical protein ACRDGL_03715 [Candidatus Limnocylindrales bacterium]